MKLPEDLIQLISEAKADTQGNWDLDDDWDPETMNESTIGRLINRLHYYYPGALRWLVVSSARYALPCWYVSLDDTGPEKILVQLEAYLCEGTEPSWRQVTRKITSPLTDCRFSDTQGAADAVHFAARYLHHLEPFYAGLSISAASIAYEHVLDDHDYRGWLLRVALPAALEDRPLSRDEQDALRGPWKPTGPGL